MSQEVPAQTNASNGAFPTEGEMSDSNDSMQLYDIPDASSTLSQISNMLSKHDKDGKIAVQIEQCLIKDSLSIDMLTNFDDKSLKQLIDSWKLDTFDEKSFVISGLLISGIKRHKNSNIFNNYSNLYIFEFITFFVPSCYKWWPHNL